MFILTNLADVLIQSDSHMNHFTDAECSISSCPRAIGVAWVVCPGRELIPTLQHGERGCSLLHSTSHQCETDETEM